MVRTAIDVARKEGFIALYNGLSASLLRQMTYSTARFGIYESLKNNYVQNKKPITFYHQLMFGMISGSIGGLIGNPADVTNIRMQAAGAAILRGEKVTQYKHALDGLIQISKSEGILSLWNGWVPNLIRGVLMTSAQLVTYDRIKSIFLSSGFSDNLLTHFLSSSCAGLVATIVCNPVDVVKTRIMNSTQKQGITNCLKELMLEGPLSFYKGFFPAWIRLGPHTVCTFIILEKLRSLCIYTGAAKPKKSQK